MVPVPVATRSATVGASIEQKSCAAAPVGSDGVTQELTQPETVTWIEQVASTLLGLLSETVKTTVCTPFGNNVPAGGDCVTVKEQSSKANISGV